MLRMCIMPGIECAPGHGLEHLDSCFTKDSLDRLVVVYNRDNPDDKIRLGLSRAETLKELQKRLRCDTDGCIADSLNAETSSLRPRRQWRSSTEWLSTPDIVDVMKQYESNFTDFHFLGVFPIDFAKVEHGICISDIMCTLNVPALAKRYKRIGAVFNLDTNDMPGSHWVALYVGLRESGHNFGFFMYDSYGMSLPMEVHEFGEHVKQSMAPGFPIEHNTHRHQREGGHCGIYCIMFLVAMLNGIDFDEYCADPKVNDKAAVLMRDVYFRSKQVDETTVPDSMR
jgi:hypothetical protein